MRAGLLVDGMRLGRIARRVGGRRTLLLDCFTKQIGCLPASVDLRCGAVAQLGERLVRNEEVSGSIPLSSTKESITYGIGINGSDTLVSLFVS